MSQIFVSYSRKDLDFVQRMAKDLQAHGLEVWYDLSGLEVGTRWGKEIQNAIQQSQYLLVVLSPNSIESEWVEKEFLYANSLKLKIIPLLYKPCSVPMWFINLHFIDVQGKNYKLHFPELLKALGIHPGEKEEKVKPAAEVHLIEEEPESQILLSKTVEPVAETPPPPQVQIPVEHGRPLDGKTQQQEKPPRKEPIQPRRKITFRPAWIILLVGLVAVTAFMVWRMRPLAAVLVHTPEVLTPTAHENVTIIIGETDTIKSLDPADAYSSLDGELIMNISAGLLGLKPGTAELEPLLAEAMPEISADGLTYTLRLRPGIKFADGLELTAPMYAGQFKRVLTIGPTCPNHAADALVTPFVESISAPDDTTIVFKLKSPAAYFSQILATTPYVPSYPDAFPDDKCVLFPTAPIYGVGPLFISQYSQAEQVVLEPNPYYTGPYPAQVDKIIIRFFADSQALAAALQKGEIDITWGALDSELFLHFQGVPGVTVGAIPGGGIRFLVINHSMAPTDDQNVDKAIASSINRNEIIDTVYSGNATPLYSMIPHGLLGATDAFDSMYAAPNLEQARNYLKASGYTATNKLVVDLWYPSDHYGASVADWMELIRQQLEATGAITANLHAQDWGDYFPTLAGGNSYPVGVLGWFMDYPDPADYIDPFTYNAGMGSNNMPKNEKAQQLIDLLSRADVETDQTVRTKLYQQAQDIHADLVLTIPLFLEAEHIIFRDNIHGSSQYSTPETLNIGPALLFSYSLLTKSP